jgi:hypothetical protein
MGLVMSEDPFTTVSVVMPTWLARRLKAMAAQEGKSIKQAVTEATDRWLLEREEPELRRKSAR